MPDLLLKYSPRILKSKPPIALPALRELLLASFHPADVDVTLRVTGKLISLIANKEFSCSMYENSPALKGYNWQAYLEASAIRISHVLAALRRFAPEKSIIFDFGSYFGNFSLAAKLVGYEVTAIDFYKQYGDNFAEVVSLLAENHIPIRETESFSEKGCADVVLSMGVIEHIPHTPRSVLHRAVEMLKPGGLLILETPNLAYSYKRQTLLQGKSIFPDIREQYYTKEPFAGHHREYTFEEVLWMLEQEGMKIEHHELFNYSYLSNLQLTQDSIDILRAGANDSSQKEIIFTVSRKIN